MRKPAGLDFDRAAALPIIGMTAWQALFDAGRLRAGQTVFIHGCLGGVGRAAAQLAQVHGATVAGSCRSGTAAEATQIGVDPVVEFHFDPTPLAGTFDLILDTAGTLPITTARTMLKPSGRIVDLVPSPRKSSKACCRARSHSSSGGREPPTSNGWRQLRHAGPPRPDRHSSPLEEAIPALTAVETGRTSRRGKLIVQID